MTYRGRVQGGVVVLADQVDLPEGTEVNVEPIAHPAAAQPAQDPPPPREQTLAEVLLSFAGKATGLPPDASRNHDRYLYGLPKK